MTKRSFFDWMEQQFGKLMDSNKLLRDFEKKYNQLLLAERRLLDPRKAELFLQAVDDALEDRLLYFLEIRILKEALPMTVSLVAKQQHIRARGIVTGSDVGPILAPKVPAVVLFTSRINKVVPEDILENLIKDFKELKVELTALRRNQGQAFHDL